MTESYSPGGFGYRGFFVGGHDTVGRHTPTQFTTHADTESLEK
jgi:hypothetical protein